MRSDLRQRLIDLGLLVPAHLRKDRVGADLPCLELDERGHAAAREELAGYQRGYRIN